MFRRKDDIRTFIVIMSVCILCVGLALILSHKSNYDKLEHVNEYNVFFSNVNYINNYISNIASNSSNNVYNLLDKDYIIKNNIDLNNVLDNVNDYSIFSSFDVTNMYFVQIKDNFIYYVEGKVYESVYDQEKKLVDDNFSVVISIDNSTKSYSLYPVDNNYKNTINNIKKVNITSNEYNRVERSELINKEQVCAIYLSDFIQNVFNDIKNSYNLLSDDMKKIYTTNDIYIKYINNNFNLMSTVADRCRLDNIEDNRVYTVIDNNENTYVFTEENIMNYKVDFYLKEN